MGRGTASATACRSRTRWRRNGSTATRRASSGSREAPAVTRLAGLPGGDRGGALAGLLVVELTHTLAGEMAGGLLADLGATVIKVEPAAGSPMRKQGPALPRHDSP